MKRLAILSLLGLCAALCAALALDAWLPARSVRAVPADWITQAALSSGGKDSVEQLTTDGTDIIGVGILGGPTPGSTLSSTEQNMLLFRLDAETGVVSRTAVFTPSLFSPTLKYFDGRLSIVSANHAFYVAGTLKKQLTDTFPLVVRAAFLAKLDTTFAVQTYTLWTSPTAYISASGLDADADGNIYVAGTANINIQGEDLGLLRGWMEKLDANLNRQCGGAFQTGLSSLFTGAALGPGGMLGTMTTPLLATPGAVGFLSFKPSVALWDTTTCKVQKSYVLDGSDSRLAWTAAWAPNAMLYTSLQTIDLSSGAGAPTKWGLALISPTGTLTPSVIDYSSEGNVQISELRPLSTSAGIRVLGVGVKSILTPSADFAYWVVFDAEGRLLSRQSYGQSGHGWFNSLLISDQSSVSISNVTAFLGGGSDQDLSATSAAVLPATLGGRDAFVERLTLDLRAKFYLPLVVRAP